MILVGSEDSRVAKKGRTRGRRHGSALIGDCDKDMSQLRAWIGERPLELRDRG